MNRFEQLQIGVNIGQLRREFKRVRRQISALERQGQDLPLKLSVKFERLDQALTAFDPEWSSNMELPEGKNITVIFTSAHPKAK